MVPWLEPGRKFMVVWNLVFAPIVFPAAFLLFFSGEPLPLNPFAMLGIFIVFGTVGGIIGWKQFK